MDTPPDITVHDSLAQALVERAGLREEAGAWLATIECKTNLPAQIEAGAVSLNGSARLERS